MKRTERHHLKENDLAYQVAAAREFIETRRSMLMPVGIGVAVLALAVIGFVAFRNSASAKADRALAEAMVALNAQVVPAGQQNSEGLPAAASLGATGTFSTEEAKLTAALPKLKAAADAYPGTPAGITARYHLAGAVATLGRTNEALSEFDEVAKQAGANSLYGRMARLGKADVQAHAGQIDAAIATWKELSTQGADELPVDAILMELAKAYLQKGDTAEARKTLTQIVDQHADSPYSADAKRELDGLKG
jgi:predicted negative regulator of RcsB-dependent stress response